MIRALFCLLLCVGGCAIAFTPGVAPAPAPEKFVDGDKSPVREEEKREGIAASRSPAFGMSLVVGGQTMDAGPLPKPPFPVVLLPH